MRLEGRAILITGASRGLGKAIAEACVREGANVFLAARDADALEQARIEISGSAPAGAVVKAFSADISDPDQARRLVEAFREAFPRVHGLVNNAAMLGPVGRLEDAGWERWTDTIHTNLLGPARLCALLLPAFRRNGYGKIVNISGGGATAPRPRFSAYGASKAALVRLTETLAEETAGSGIDINAIAPGAMNTRLLDETLAAGPERAGEQIYFQAIKQKEDGGASPEKAVALSVFLLSAASDGISGRLLAALWDDWRQLPSRRDALRETDVYTLRRIVPADRGFDW